ncbi:hypothetical protein LTR37_006742 [Vermiconidia calcicola]|uniref:Uncharacterized protein n=1 Tax=Vermiconidia calcicola TaxID=1690605 RepID=A0ACC3NH54_9PEZI|nr:hypothetical protein LTR37_006742 [Vermiconidia calcicola]
MSRCYSVKLGGSAVLNAERLKSALEDLVRGQLLRRIPSSPAAHKCEYGVQVRRFTGLKTTISITLLDDHDPWLLDAIKSLESVVDVSLYDADRDGVGEADLWLPSSDTVGAQTAHVDGCLSTGRSALLLLDMPTEIRLSIFEYALSHVPAVSDPAAVLDFKQPVPVLCQVSRQVRKEAMRVAYEFRLQTIAGSVTGQTVGLGAGQIQRTQAYRAVGGLPSMRDLLTDARL